MTPINYKSFVQLDDGIYWIGKYIEKEGLHSNAYLIVDNSEAVIIDGGSRPDFSNVMLKILETGVTPNKILALIYHHYDPDLCGSITHFEELIHSNKLVTISQRHNNVFIHHYGTQSKKLCINALGNQWSFPSGRTLKFINTPYAHSPGSFVTWDEKTKTLFSSDIFGSYSSKWDLFLNIEDHCHNCTDFNHCKYDLNCFMKGIEYFHSLIMTSNKALHGALDDFKKYPIERIAPQHGSIIEGNKNIQSMIKKLQTLSNIGIDGQLDGKIY